MVRPVVIFAHTTMAGMEMLHALSPVGTELRLPEYMEEDDPYFTPDRLDEAAVFYDEQGYVVLRGLIPPEMCRRARTVFDADVRASRIPILRQKNMRYERNVLDSDGFLNNPIFNVQDLGSGVFKGFRDAVLDVLTYPAAVTAVLLHGDRTKLIQSMFFEAPAGTWAHQDSYYQDSATALGRCVAGWFALENIDARAGRFYVCPTSHRTLTPLRNEGAYNIATGHPTYKQAMLDTIRERQLTLTAPYLAAGDVLFWNSLTVHGSLPASAPGVSRTSLTAHYLHEEDAVLQFHNRIRAQRVMVHNGMTVGLLHDQDMIQNRMVREVAFHFPRAYMTVRQWALMALMKKESTGMHAPTRVQPRDLLSTAADRDARGSFPTQGRT